MSPQRFSSRTKHPEVTLYQIEGGKKYDSEVWPIVKRCQEAAARIQSGTKDMGKWIGWVRTEPVSPEDRATFLMTKEVLKRAHEAGWRGGKNILKKSTREDTMIWHGKDSNVFAYPGKTKKFIYKETAQEGSLWEAKPENVIYLRRKYDLLKKYLGNTIPQTRFVLGEVNHPTRIAKGIEMVDIPQKSIITLQRRVAGSDLQKMPREAKSAPLFLKKLKKAHQKYILLKMFIASISRELGLPEDTLDVKMDLGPLSDMDRFDIQDPTSIRKHLTSPNIMWDGKQIYFVDMDTGTWNTKKEKLHAYLMMPDTIQRWDEMMGNMGLLDDYRE